MIGDLFSYLQQALGYVLSFFFELLTPWLNDGTAYGISIIMLTITINLVVFPLTLKQTRATRAFTEIQPQIRKIQAEYKENPQEMQKRLMEVQKEAGATPGGCLLPMLVQMPIWFALFRVLGRPFVYILDPETKQPTLDAAGNTQLDPTAIQPINPTSALGQSLRSGQPETFLGMDLGTSPSQAMQTGLMVALPYLLMIGIMVATQYVQQWHSTYGQEKPTGQGTQQALTKIMPLFIGFISWNFPAGLVLYWATSNLFRLGQQAVIFRIDGRPTPSTAVEKSSRDRANDGTAVPDEGKKQPQPGANSRRRRRRRK